MRIRTLLTGSVSLSILMVLGLGAAIWTVDEKLDRLSRAQSHAQSVVREVSALMVLTHEYALHAESRPVQQWRVRHQRIVDTLNQGKRDEVATPPEALEQAQALSAFFDQLVAARSADDSGLQHRRAGLLLDQLLTHTQALSDSVNRWADGAVAARGMFEHRFRILAVAVPVMMLVILLVLAILLGRRVLRPLSRFHDAVLAVARGDLSVRCATASSDELGVLSRTFDAMAVDLVNQLRTEIAERKRTEQTLVESENRFRRVSSMTSDLIYSCWRPDDGSFQIDWLGGNSEQLFGYGEAELRAIGCWKCFIVEEDRPLFARSIADLKPGESSNAIFHIVHRNGSMRCLHSYAQVEEEPVAEDHHHRLYGALQDITEREQAEEALRRLNATLDQRVREEVAKNMQQERLLIHQSRLAAMGEMIGNIAHQWRQPLNALGLLLANLKDEYEFKELNQASLDKTILNARGLLEKMSATIDDFRNFFKPNKEKVNFTLSSAVADTIHLVAPSFKGHGIEIEVEGDDPVEVSGYPNELSQVLLNIFTNAKEAFLERKTDHPRIVVSWDWDPEYARLTVRDNAGGIPEEVLTRVFEPYFTTKEKGTGIGLYMSRTIMEHMDGQIDARNVGDGAEFIVTCPAWPKPADAVGQDG